MNARARPSRKLQWPQVAGLALAGLLSFAVAAYWNIASSKDSDDVVAPVIRPRPTAGAETASAMVQTSVDSMQTTDEPMLQMNVNSERLNSTVTRNPFGDLNLLASLELAAGRNSAATVKTVSAVARKPKPEPPPPPTIEAPPPPPPPPTAPALPFTVVGGISGQKIAEGRPVAFLRQHDEVMVVRPGDEIGSTYRVETITIDRIDFTYLPLKQRQTLSMKP